MVVLRKTMFLCAVMLYALALGCASAQPRQDFNGSWVVDLEASKAINPRAELPRVQENMSNIVMTIDMVKYELTLFYKDHNDSVVMAFSIVSEQPGLMVIDISEDSAESGPQLQLSLKNGALTFDVVGDEERADSFVFVRSE